VRIGTYEVDVPRALLAGFAVVVIGALVYGGATSVAAFGAFNPSWEGTSDLRGLADDAGADTEVARNTTAYEAHGNETVAVVVAPDEAYTAEEVRRIEAFLERGGTLLIAARSGTANELLEALDAEVRLDGDVLRDEQQYYRAPALPEATNVTEHNLTRDVDSLTLNYGTAVEPGEATVLVASSEFAYLDRNGNEQVDEAERLGSYPVATTESVEDGRLIVVSDGSAFINVMADRPGNRAFATNAFNGSETVLIDTSHSGDVPPVISALLTVRGSPPLQGGLVAVALLFVFGWQTGLLTRGDEDGVERRPDADTLADTATDRYPSMERRRVGRLMKGIKSISSQRGDDE